MTDSQFQSLYSRVEKGFIAEFVWQGMPYLIQTENNKGWDYIGLWRIAPEPKCLARALFDVFDGIDRETVTELLSQPCLDGQSFLDRLPEIEPAPCN